MAFEDAPTRREPEAATCKLRGEEGVEYLVDDERVDPAPIVTDLNIDADLG